MGKRKSVVERDHVRYRERVSCTRMSLKRAVQQWPNEQGVDVLAPWIQHAVHDINRLVIVVNRLAKLHLLQCLEQGILNFKVNDTYLCRLQTMVSGGHVKRPEPYDESFHEILRQQQLPEVKCDMPAGIRAQCFLYEAQKLLTNWQTHNTMRLEQHFRVWWRNHARQWVTDAMTTRERKQVLACDDNMPEKWSYLYPLKHALQQRYQAHRMACMQHMTEVKEEYYGPSLKITNHVGVLQSLHRMALENARIPGAKQLALFPERQMALGCIRLDKRTLNHLVYQMANPAQFTLAQVKADPEMVLATVFTPWARKQVRKNGWTLSDSLVTDGVGCSLQFTKEVAVTGSKRFKKGQTQDLATLHRGARHANFVRSSVHELTSRLTTAVDPGVASVVTSVSLRGPTFQLTQGRYREESGLNWYQGVVRGLCKPLRGLDEALAQVPHRRSPVLAQYQQYVGTLWSQWDARWAIITKRRWRKAKFRARNLRESLLARTADALVRGTPKGPVPKQAVVIYGQGGGEGRGFGRLKGGGVKGPVKKIQDMVAQRALVLKADEFRTSKCCRHCHCDLVSGAAYRVRFCPNPTCHAMLHRDIDAAYKIQARTAAVLLGEPLSVFQRGTASWGPWSADREYPPFVSLALMNEHLQHATAGGAGSGVVA